MTLLGRYDESLERALNMWAHRAVGMVVGRHLYYMTFGNTRYWDYRLVQQFKELL